MTFNDLRNSKLLAIFCNITVILSLLMSACSGGVDLGEFACLQPGERRS